MDLVKPLIEPSFFDKKGREIKEFALLKIFHFKGVNEQGRGRKNYYMYKWVKLVEWKGTKYWTGFDLSDGGEHYFHLRSIADSNRVLQTAEIIN